MLSRPRGCSQALERGHPLAACPARRRPADSTRETCRGTPGALGDPLVLAESPLRRISVENSSSIGVPGLLAAAVDGMRRLCSRRWTSSVFIRTNGRCRRLAGRMLGGILVESRYRAPPPACSRCLVALVSRWHDHRSGAGAAAGRRQRGTGPHHSRPRRRHRVHRLRRDPAPAGQSHGRRPDHRRVDLGDRRGGRGRRRRSLAFKCHRRGHLVGTARDWQSHRSPDAPFERARQRKSGGTGSKVVCPR